MQADKGYIIYLTVVTKYRNNKRDGQSPLSKERKVIFKSVLIFLGIKKG